MSKKLFLSSYFSGVKNLLPDFTNNECSGKKVVFIPTASVPEKVTFFVGADKKSLAKLGLIIDELEVSTAPYEEITSKISNADYLFVEGGNTFFLLQELKRTGADTLIIEHINKGKLYIGASAGSMIISKDIEYVKFMDNPKAAPDLNGDFSALSVLDFYIVPHCTNFPFKKATEKIVATYSETLDLRLISNNQVIVVNGDKVETLTVEGEK
ncbi:putative peptidase Lmo0363 [Bacteroidia bacterium]|nr:putative peptidase Lmo0363 [Bacteroidia bacterium]